MQYQIRKIRNGRWVLENEARVITQHSDRHGAEKALLQIERLSNTDNQ